MAIDLSTLSDREALTAVYIGYYDRAADPAGIAFWEQVVTNTSLDLVAITSDFAGQSETQAVHPFFASPSESAAGAFITTLYLNLFNREPDDAGLAFWTNELQAAVAGARAADDPNPDAPVLTVGQIITSIIEGAEDIDGGTQDRSTILNKIEVALDWTAAAEDSDIDFAANAAAQASASSIIDGVTDQQSTVDAALATTDDFFAEDGNNGGLEGDEIELGFGGQDPVTGQFTPFDNLTGTAGADHFHAEDGAFVSGDQIDGGAGRDGLTVFTEDNFNGAPVSARTESVESFYITNQTPNFSGGDNNIEGFGQNSEVDGGRMVGVDRWEDYDSRADVLIEDARDDDDTDGTFTGDITVAMVSTDPGNVDYAVYFDGPVNTAANDDSIFIEVIDQNNSDALSAADITAATAGNLEDAQLTEFSILVDGVRVTVDMSDPDVVGTAHFGADATYTDLLNAIDAALDNTTLADGSTLGDDLSASIGSTFFENIGNDNDNVVAGTLQQVFGLRIVLRSESGVELGDAGVSSTGEGDIVVVSRDDPADVAQAISNEENIIEELIRVNIELDDVGKGSMGGDLVAGAMSTGRNDGDRTSDSIGIQQFDIEVDRSSQLQTINSTNNSLEVVNISNGENGGLYNTTTAADEMIGDLVVRGVANPGSQGGGTNDHFPGAQNEHNEYGFTDVRVINGSAMVGALDITAELTEEIVEKYLDIQDTGANGEADDVAFTYTLGANNDEFFLNMSADALNSAGTGSREDFDMTTAGGAGNDVITTNVGQSFKQIDEQGQDYYVMNTQNFEAWYENSVFTNASTFTVSGGSGDDTIWTNGWGDTVISDGSGSDAVYTDNSGVVNANVLANNIDRNPDEHDPIDHVIGAAWAFNAEATNGFDLGGDNPPLRLSGATNEQIILAPTPATVTTLSSGTATITVSFTAEGGATGTATDGVYTVTADIPVSQLSLSGGNVVTTEQAFNQAIKAAVNNDQTLSQLLEASDGPGNSLIVATKIDGDWLGTELDVAFTGLTVNGNTGLIGAAINPAGYIQAVDVEFGNGGQRSVAESDNTINVAADGNNDVFVLSTNDDEGPNNVVFDGLLDDPLTDLDGSSNETLRFADGNFGSDTVVNFDSGVAAVTTGFDVMDFLAIDFDPAQFSNGAFLVTDDSISLELETAGNDETSEIAVSYAGLVAGEEAIAIVYDPADDNRGTVYHVVGNGTAADNATATNVGNIELIGTDWATMTVDNFA